MSNSEILISDSTFEGISLSTIHSNVTIINSLFTGNVGDDGGAIHALSTRLTLTGNIFIGNVANNGGAIFAEDCFLSVIGTCPLDAAACNASTSSGNGPISPFRMAGNMQHETRPVLGIAYFSGNKAKKGGGAVCLSNSRAVFSGTVTVFEGNSASRGGAIHTRKGSELVLNGNYFLFMNNSARLPGGAIDVNNGHLRLLPNEARFVRNRAFYGGAIFLRLSLATFCGKVVAFEDNLAKDSGGGVYVYGGLGNGLDIERPGVTFSTETLLFTNNSAKKGGAVVLGAGSYVVLYTSIFAGNKAVEGGALYLKDYSSVQFNGKGILFINNSAKEGGGMKLFRPELVISTEPLRFIANTAEDGGGALYVQTVASSSFYGGTVSLSGNFTNNQGSCGGAIFIVSAENVALSNITVTDNIGSAICIHESNVTFHGIIVMNNAGKLGGGIHSRTSSLTFTGCNLLCGN